MLCTVCGSTTFSHHSVLWDELISEWQLSPDEVAYVNAQQGTCCTSCGANLRSVALAMAIQVCTNQSRPLAELVASGDLDSLSVLEINEAGTLSPYLRRLPGHTYAAYPDVDIQSMRYASDRFDLVVHSDTLEHVAHPIRGLAECHRVLRAGGMLCFTVPMIVGRMTRNRAGLPKSYHGGRETDRDDFVVHTEFGTDTWTYPVQAGFKHIELVCPSYPAAIALIARKAKDA